MKLYSFLFLCFVIIWGNHLWAQTVVQGDNHVGKEGAREGKWIIWFNHYGNQTLIKDSAAYYREVTYLEGKPNGLVKEYYLNGKTKWEGYLVMDQPVDIRNGKSISYDDEGNKVEEAQYNRIGKKTSSKEYKKPIQGSDTLNLLYRQGNVSFVQGNLSKALEYWNQGSFQIGRQRLSLV